MNPIPTQIKALLDQHSCEYEMFEHEPVRTSVDASKIRPGISLHQGAKALVCEAKYSDGEKEKVMVVVPADLRANLKTVRKELKAKDLYLISPSDVLQCTGVEVGGVPPFGNLFGFKVFTDKGLFENEEIAFNAGSRTITVIMKSVDYERLVKPIIGAYSASPH